MTAPRDERGPRRAVGPEGNEQGDGGGERTGWFWALVGPPWMALQRAAGAVRDRIAQQMERLAAAWRHLFLGQDPDEEVDLTPPVATSVLLAAVVLALALYSWPLRDILPVPLFVGLAVVVFFVAFAAIRKASVRGGSGRAWERWLSESERRVGMVWWERLGAALALAGAVGAFWLGPTVLPLAVGALLGFGALLVQPPDSRESRTVRQLPPLPEPELDPIRRDGDGWVLPEDYVERSLAWSVRRAFGTDSHQVTVQLHEPTYARTKRLNPGRRWEGDVPRLDLYVVDGTTPDVERAASALHALSSEGRYSTYEEVSLVLSMVQSIPYSRDIDSTGQEDYWRYPIETFYDATGDCEDTTILAAALLRRLGHAVVALSLPEHAALAVEVPTGLPGRFVQHGGRRYYYCETTDAGWEVGEIPKHLIDADVRIIPIAPLPDRA